MTLAPQRRLPKLLRLGEPIGIDQANALVERRSSVIQLDRLSHGARSDGIRGVQRRVSRRLLVRHVAFFLAERDGARGRPLAVHAKREEPATV